MIRASILIAVLASGSVASGQPLSTAFTYQGELLASSAPANGTYDFRFTVYSQAFDGAPIAATQCLDNVTVNAGKFTVVLDFGDVFVGDERYLQIEVRPDTGLGCASSTGFVALTPRQRLTAAPHALHALTAGQAGWAADATTFGGQVASFYTNAANLNAGTLPDARLSSNVTTLSGSQVFIGPKTFSAAPSFAAAGSPFSVSSTTRVNNLNADLLDGLDSAAFATAGHTHDASGITSGTLLDARIPTSIPRLGNANVFTDTQVVNVSNQTPLTLIGSSTSGTWVNLQNTGGGRVWNMIATGSGNGEGAGKFLLRDQTGGAVRLTLDTAGRLGLGTTAPSALLELSQPDATLRIRNTNDPGGGYIQDTFSTLQLGLYNPTASAWGAVPAGASRALFGLQNTGRVGTLTNTGGSPAWRNTLDDGAGNASIQGNLSANNLPAIKFGSTNAAGTFANNSVTLIENMTVNVPASGYLRITARAAIQLRAYDPTPSRATLELKETTSGEVVIKDTDWGIANGTATLSGMVWQGDITLEHSTFTGAGTRSFKLRLLHSSQLAGNNVQYSGAEITVMYFPAGL